MKSEQIQETVYNWAKNRKFTAPYGVLTGNHSSPSGRKYRGVTFGFARTRDVEVRIYNRNFFVIRDSVLGITMMKSFDLLMEYLNETY